MQTKESFQASNSNKQNWSTKLDRLIENACDDSDNSVSLNSIDPQFEHDYDIAKTSSHVISYIAGYLAHKMAPVAKCFSCTKSMQSTERRSRDKFIQYMDKGALCYPSEELFKLIASLEEVVLMVVGTKPVKYNTMFSILDDICKTNIPNFVGCKEHQKELTKKNC